MVNIYTTETSISQFVVYIKCSANITLTLSIPNTILTASILTFLHIVKRSARKPRCWEMAPRALRECCWKVKHLLCQALSFASYCLCQSITREQELGTESESRLSLSRLMLFSIEGDTLLLKASSHHKKQK
uniref:Uncharacterized protein n=1 Tax=Glossina pallidipes TaxID=7398 RepID=A0A1B0A7Y3_GLOPL